jgi:glutaredoxin-like protein NrdH
VYIVAAIIIIIGIAAVVLKNNRSKPAADVPQKDDGPQGDPALYALGMNPISDKLIMYALETCQHCKNTRKFLDSHNVEYITIYLDQYSGSKRSDLMEKVRTYNPRGTFPTMVVPGGKIIVGFRKQLLQEALFHDSDRIA